MDLTYYFIVKLSITVLPDYLSSVFNLVFISFLPPEFSFMAREKTTLIKGFACTNKEHQTICILISHTYSEVNFQGSTYKVERLNSI